MASLFLACGGEDLSSPGGVGGAAGGGGAAAGQSGAAGGPAGAGGQGGAGASGGSGAGQGGEGAGEAGAGQSGVGGAAGGGGGTCQAPQEVCGGTCVDTTQDAANCGECGKACATGESCVSGICQGACAGTAKKCGGQCVDPQSDPQNCGGCGTVCAKVCSQGSCADGCAAGLTECSGACVDLKKDMNHCGDCASTCDQGQGCIEGACVLQCAATQKACGDVCVTTATDPQNCGDCGKSCAGAEQCAGGSCQCQSPGKVCGGVCVDTSNDDAHCGDCGTTCGASEMCQQGKCVVSCSASQKECGGKCTDTLLDSKNCGGCGKPCKQGEACSKGMCSSTCAAPTTLCEGSCVELATDPQNCGGCGKPCGQGEVCAGGSCQVSCAGKLNSPVTDPWGNAWDGLERAAGTLAAAEAACKAIGGGLPTATELFRVSATQTATVGQSNNVNNLWSRVPSDVASQAVVRLSDGQTGQAAVTQSLHYRCVCAAPHPESFTGANCNGPQGSACVPLPVEKGHRFIDAADRARLTRAAANFECSESLGRVAMPEEYAALVATGATGSGAPLRASEEMSRTTDATVKWIGNESQTWKAATRIDNVGLAAQASFRCVGAGIDTTLLLPSVPGSFSGKRSRLVVDSSTRTSGSWGAVHDVCTAQGGHIARADDLWRLAQDGLPGDGVELSTADQDGASVNTTTNVLNGWLLASIQWSGAVPRLGSGAINWIARGTANPKVRCVYYPVDESYQGPSASQCNSGGCFSMTLSTGARMWVDREDRSPDATLEQAYTTCREHGGRLASQRDLVEAVHANLGNGSGKALLNSDLAFGTLNAPRAMVSIFTGAPGKDDTDQYSATPGKGYTSWSNLDTARPYRCMWTNELR